MNKSTNSRIAAEKTRDTYRKTAAQFDELGRVLINRHQLNRCEECLLYPQ